MTCSNQRSSPSSARWCSYTGADTAGIARMKSPANVRAVRVPCSGRVSPELVMRAFDQGADGVLVLGCHIGECHYDTGNHRAAKRLPILHSLDDICRSGTGTLPPGLGLRFGRGTLLAHHHRIYRSGARSWAGSLACRAGWVAGCSRNHLDGICWHSDARGELRREDGCHPCQGKGTAHQRRGRLRDRLRGGAARPDTPHLRLFRPGGRPPGLEPGRDQQPDQLSAAQVQASKGDQSLPQKWQWWSSRATARPST